MKAPDDMSTLEDGDPERRYSRRISRRHMPVIDSETGERRLAPAIAFQFDSDLSIHQIEHIEASDSCVEDEYGIPPEGAVEIPVKPLIAGGAFLKRTPNEGEGLLGMAHHSIFGSSKTPSKTDRANMRDIIEKELKWIQRPSFD